MRSIWRILGSMRPYRGLVIWNWVFMACLVAADLANPRRLHRIIDRGNRAGIGAVILESS